MKKYFLTTAIMGMFIAPVFGADKIITSENTCTVDVLGVSDNNAVANTIATWDAIEYTLNPGQYLSVTETSVHKTTCPAGSYCIGGTGFTVDNANTSIAQCPTGYENSDAGAGADTQCYTACTVDMVAKATAVTGNDYYDTGVDTCGATACEMGYHVDGGGLELVEKDPLILVDYTLAGNGYAYITQDGTAGSNDTAVVLNAQNTWAVEFDYGTVYGKASCQPKADAGNMYIYNNVDALIRGRMTMEEFRAGLVELVGESRADAYMGSFAISLAGDMSEEEQITAVKKYFAVSIATDGNYTTDSTGQYCYCQMDGFTPTGGTKEIVTSAPWVPSSGYGSAGDCASNCAEECALDLRRDGVDGLAMRAAAFGALEAVEMGGMCKITENNCLAGQYLAIVGDAMMCVPCKTGSYCPGGVYTIESENKGTNICPSGYPNSDAGASADTQCYRACSVDMFAHATAVSGNDYFGTGVDTCSATACETGYHVDGGRLELVEKTPLAPISLTDAGDGYRYVRANGRSGSYYNVDAIPADSVTAPNTWATAYSDGVVYGKASCQPGIDPALKYIYNNQSALMDGQMSLEDFLTGLEPLAGPVKTEYVKNTFIGYATGAISVEEAQKRAFGVFYMDPNANYSTDSTGQYCYCQMDGFMPNGGTKETVTSAPWVFNDDYGSADSCAGSCAYICADYLWDDNAYYLTLRAAVVGALGYTEASVCSANIINIDWNPDNNGAHTINQCTYDGAITVPADPVKPGHIFMGWKLLEETTTE